MRRDQTREQVDREGIQGRVFGVLAVLVPVIGDVANDVAYPGDPMALYHALAAPMGRALASFTDPFGPTDVYSDLCPNWPRFPTPNERHGVRGRFETAVHNTDQTVFDPRVWDDHSRSNLEDLLRRRRPAVVLLSSVSPAHSVALDIAEIVRSVVPDALIVLGGRHADETMTVREGSVLLEPSATAAVDIAGVRDVDVNVVVAGDGAPLLDLVLRAAALAMDVQSRIVDPGRLLAELDVASEEVLAGGGRGVIVVKNASQWHAYDVRGTAAQTPPISPYAPFLVRARFPVLADEEGRALLCAHVNMVPTCPMRCTFCSESSVIGTLKSLGADGAEVAVNRLVELVTFGAEAVFFDDPIFWSGSFPRMESFAQSLRDRQAAARRGDTVLDKEQSRRFAHLRWGIQPTVDTVTRGRPRDVFRVLQSLRDAGCRYVYVGIESMAEQVMVNVHKNIRREERWASRVRAALRLLNDAGLEVGSSVLFGLDGEDAGSIDETIEAVGELIDEGLLMIASPNILTYHPGTPVTRAHGMTELIDYHSTRPATAPPYSLFEEAHPGVVSRLLSENDIWRIHHGAGARWGAVRHASSDGAPAGATL